MKYIAIPEDEYRLMIRSLDKFIQEISDLCGGNELNPRWLDTQEVCVLLKISKRTLQYHKAAGKLPFSMIGNKTYFKTSDIGRYIEQSKHR